MDNKVADIECDFCNELNGEDNLYWRVAEKYGLSRNRMIYEGRNWVIWPTIGAIIPGYVLIVSKKHHISMMDCDKKEIIELEYLIKETRRILESIYHFPCIMFEHGGGCGNSNKSSSIDHCHLHVMPIKEDIYNKIDVDKFKIIELKSLNEFDKRKRHNGSYLLYQNHKEQFFIMYANTYISQYFRQLIALSVGFPEKWNWRHNYFVENINKTINDINLKLSSSSLGMNLDKWQGNIIRIVNQKRFTRNSFDFIKE